MPAFMGAGCPDTDGSPGVAGLGIPCEMGDREEHTVSVSLEGG